MSSNKTANLQLNQWQAGDAFLREEFNQDNGKIDAAVGAVSGANCMVKLLDLTTTAEAAQVDLDVSGIHWNEYVEVQFYAHILSKGGGNFRSTVNNLRGNEDYLNWSNNGGVFANHLWVFYADDTKVNACKHILPCITGKTAAYAFQFGEDRLVFSGGYCRNRAAAQLSDVKTINIFSEYSNATLAAGSQFYLYGVKK